MVIDYREKVSKILDDIQEELDIEDPSNALKKIKSLHRMLSNVGGLIRTTNKTFTNACRDYSEQIPDILRQLESLDTKLYSSNFPFGSRACNFISRPLDSPQMRNESWEEVMSSDPNF